MNAYKRAIFNEMNKLGKMSNSIFLGQQVADTDFYGTLSKISMSKRIEMPVAEEMQLGMSIGLALEGYLPISIYQRMDFLPRACDQLVNHLDLINLLSNGKFEPKVIIRTTVGSSTPLDTGLQHRKDLTKGFKALLQGIHIYNVKTPKEVHKYYTMARKLSGSFLIIEYQDLYL